MDREWGEQVKQAAEIVAASEALLVCAGAGMGVDSGLPDFRGPEGFWNAYPPYRRLGLDFHELADPDWFSRDPELAWGFYGHRLELYRRTVPHRGFALLLAWARAKPAGHFVFTSNVDGQFQKAGVAEERIHECHGSLHHLQCACGCPGPAWTAEGVTVAVDKSTMRARPPLPDCPFCGRLARPNVLMFGDWSWQPQRSQAQALRLRDWLDGIEGQRLAVVECGAGTAVPSVRHMSERMLARPRTRLVRINAREAEVPEGQVGLAGSALSALEAISASMPGK
ncbi:MAG: NAD-dependent protein deacetylase [Candidatus Aminicenantes bacterium]|nr:NAD-dependent protein deacetylase [Candidatus Aminicenantes bacterium]